MMKKICIITGSRSEFGLLKNLIMKLNNLKNFKTKVFATGSHLSKEFGFTYKEILNEKIKIHEKVNILNNNNKKKKSNHICDFKKYSKI
tara:strand:+ start:485 stop:751 length:267 start_codon:yes stop_codon:yes gene_type:complete